jgi:hypothetical protein
VLIALLNSYSTRKTMMGQSFVEPNIDFNNVSYIPQLFNVLYTPFKKK